MLERPARALTKLGANVVALGSVLAGKALIACGLRRPPEGWRRTLGILLRSEPTRFALSAFGLHALDAATTEQGRPAVERHLAERLRAYLDVQPDAHFLLEWRDAVTIRRRTSSVDVALLRFSASGELQSLEPHFAVGAYRDLAATERDQEHRSIIDAYNGTRLLPETERPRALRKSVDSPYARRVLSACCLSFEDIDLSDPVSRFRPPSFHARRSLGFGFLSVVMRLGADRRTVDVWMSAHHVGLDGVPLQELLTGLEQSWGIAQPTVFPAADCHQPFMEPRRCSLPGERDVDEMLTFMDFSSVLTLRDELNERYAAKLGGPVTFGALLAWLLNGEPRFAGARVASTVDVAASGGYDRDVDVIPLRPADYATAEDPWAGFVEFAREFNRLIALSRSRTSPLRQGLQTAGLLPAWVHSQAVRSNPASLDDAFGSLCVTIVRDAKVFVAPMTDLGLGLGFFAIGNAGLPSVDGRGVTAVSIKGDAGTIAGYPALLRRIVERSAGLRQTDMASGV
jgi:hypothetical protein